MTDEWVDIKGYENIYKINKQGQIMSIKRQTPVTRRSQKLKKIQSYNANYKSKLLKCVYTTGNIPVVHLYKNGKMTSFAIKKLLRISFPDLDSESLNNIIDNIKSQRYTN